MVFKWNSPISWLVQRFTTGIRTELFGTVILPEVYSEEGVVKRGNKNNHNIARRGWKDDLVAYHRGMTRDDQDGHK